MFEIMFDFGSPALLRSLELVQGVSDVGLRHDVVALENAARAPSPDPHDDAFGHASRGAAFRSFLSWFAAAPLRAGNCEPESDRGTKRVSFALLRDFRGLFGL